MAKLMQDIVLVIQRCWILGNLIEGLLFLFTINCSVTIQLAEPNHGSWTVGVQLLKRCSRVLRGNQRGCSVEKKHIVTMCGSLF